MSSDIFVIYQIDNSEKNREYRCRSYEYQIQHGFMITADNYGTGYSGTATRGMGEEAIRKKMESINPDKFKIRKFGVSDVIGLTAAGKTYFFYVDKDRLVRFNGFFPKPQSGTYLILDEGGYQVAGQKGTWLVSDEVEVDGQRFVQMRSEQTKSPPPSIILHESGAFVTQTALGFDGEATRKMRTFLQGPKPELLHHQKFFENGTAERAKESGTEQNYNMIGTFDKHLNKILTSLSIDPDTLMGFSPRVQSVDAVYSQNAPIDYQMNDKAKMEYDLLQDILNLCSVYY